MKYLLIVGDGMADHKVEALNNRTPLEYVNAPSLARIGGGELGRLRTCPEGLAPGSDVAFLTLLGQDTAACYTGRSPLEAAGDNIRLEEGQVSFRMNLCSIEGPYEGGIMASYNGDGIDGEDAYQLVSDLVADARIAELLERAEMRLYPTPTFRHIAVIQANDEPFVMTPPHDIAGCAIDDYLPRGQKCDDLRALQKAIYEYLSVHPINARRAEEGRLPANAGWFWGPGRAAILRSFEKMFGKTGTAVTAVPLVRGIAYLSGLKAPRIDGATGTLETNYAGKIDALIKAYESGDEFVLLHLEAPDDMSHLGDVQGKVEAIRRLDQRLIKPALDWLDGCGEPYRALVMPDHYTLLSNKKHDGTPVPYAIYDSRKAGATRPFTEALCADCPLTRSGVDMLRRLFEQV